MFYDELKHIHKDKSGKGRHARCFGPAHCQYYAFIAYLCVPSPQPGTNLNPALVEDALTSAALGVAGGPVGRTRSGLGDGC